MYLPLNSQPNSVGNHFKQTAPTMANQDAVEHKS